MGYIKIIGFIVGAMVVALSIFMWSWQRPVLYFDENKIPQDLIKAQFIDLDRVYAISKFRSGAGHDYSHGAWDGETCRSMKHYFNTGGYKDATGKIVRSLPTSNEPNIDIYAPFDGTITSATPEHVGTQVHIRSTEHPEFYARIFHVDLLPEIRVGDKVISGKRIGFIGPKDATDFALEVRVLLTKTVYVSYFATMADEVFKPFAKMGFKREDFIISKEYRDLHPFICGGKSNNPLIQADEAFHHQPGRNFLEDFIILHESPYLEALINQSQGSVQINSPTRDDKTGTKDQNSDLHKSSNQFIPPHTPKDVFQDTNEPPLTLKSIGMNLDYYNPSTNRAGDIQFTPGKVNTDLLFSDYGYVINGSITSGGQDKISPQPTFILPLGTPVRSLVDGIVISIPKLYSGDYSIHVGLSENSRWRYETEHVIHPLVKVGDRVSAGQVIAEVSSHDNQGHDGFGMFEIGILKGGNPPQHLCPFAYLDHSIKDDVQKKLISLYAAWEKYRGDSTLYNEGALVMPGCLTLDPVDG